MIRKIIAAVVGILAAFALVMAIEGLGYELYPLPDGLDTQNLDQMRKYVESLPPQALLIVLSAWIVATVGGGLLACIIAKVKPLLFASLIGLVIMGGSIYTMLEIPHPTWFMAAAIAGILMAIFITVRIARIFVKV
ncbi:MAG: hypothetical protein IH931_03715 [candidate division Zixibacteria bacterium]|nr:hypothetical protein [candidate division Zixibacteria bacterium]